MTDICWKMALKEQILCSVDLLQMLEILYLLMGM
jgi:hypothetical protein